MNHHARSTPRADGANNAAPTFGEARKPFLDAGIGLEALIPVAPRNAKVYVTAKGRRSINPDTLGKVPGRYLPKNGEWCGLSRDQGEASILDTGATPEEQRQFMTWPTPNVGILGRFYPGIDADTNTPAAARLVDKAIAERFGADTFIPRRIRGGSIRALFMFEADTPGAVTSRSVEFELPGEPKGTTHKLEVSGQGRQWVAAGIHPSGQSYGWDGDNHISDARDGDLIVITDADVAAVLDAFARELAKVGGVVLSRGAGKASGGGSGQLRDFSRDDPVMPVATILDGLDKLPNTEAAFPSRESLVGILSAIRAALGCEAEANEGRVREWAVDSSDGWCREEEDFGTVWRSIDSGVYAERDSLDRQFRRAGIFVLAPADFPDDAHKLNAEIRRRIGDAKAEEVRLLREIAQKLIFSPVDTSAGEAFPQVRSRGKIDGQEKGRDWWAGKSLLSDELMLKELHEIFGRDDIGFWRFFRALNAAHPDCIFRALVKNPLVDIGEMVECTDKQGNAYYELNNLALPAVQKLGAALPKGSCSPKHNADVAAILDFMGLTFCEFVDFELDTIAFMAQKKKRVGNGLILHGDPGVGKSAYCDILSGLFNSPGEANYIPGNILKADDRAFAMTALEGARILELREIPSKWTASAKAGFESLYKQVIDSSVAGDTVKIEAKGKDARAVPNYARLVATTNNMDAIEISAQDRRLFYVSSGIKTENMPTKAWWADLHAVLNEPKRMACFWRYLLDRDVERFNHHQTPPVTRAKLAQQVATIENPASRHMRVVVMALSAAGRRLVDSAEIKTLMHAAAVNEARNTKRRVDDRDAYTNDGLRMGTVKEAFLFLQTRYPVLREMRTGKARLGTMYAVSGDLADTLADANNRELAVALDDDRERHRLSEDHWPTGYEGPLRPDAKGADDFTDHE